LLLLLRTLLPKELGIEVVILADRGFGRTELGRFCQRYGFHYVIRIQPKVKLRLGSVSRRLDLYPVQKGICRRLNDVLYRDKDPVQQHVIIRWKPGLARDRDECWYLMTDLPQSARTLSDLYARRMGVEQLFRDAKNKRNGWSLRDTPITAPARLDRLILVMAIAYLLLTAVGLLAQTRYRPSAWSSNNRPDSLSAFRIGQLMLDQLDVTIATLIDALLHATPKWG
jgi:hypothetical protein